MDGRGGGQGRRVFLFFDGRGMKEVGLKKKIWVLDAA
jgi:hypothetical protein